MTPLITIVVPFYAQPYMLEQQFLHWTAYRPKAYDAFRFVVVDDGSPEPAEAVMEEFAANYEPLHAQLPVTRLYRIEEDVPWNRGFARNLGTHVAETPWVLHVDTDHVIPAETAEWLVENISALPINRWYRFRRYRVGKADFTRNKDAIARDETFGEIKPHIDSYLCTKDAYWRAGGYNQKFAGVLGGGSPFLKEMERANGEPVVLDCALHVHTTDSVPDASITTLSRDPAHFARRKSELLKKYGTLKGVGFEDNLPWHRVF